MAELKVLQEDAGQLQRLCAKLVDRYNSGLQLEEEKQSTSMASQLQSVMRELQQIRTQLNLPRQ